jgi:hypothetical protein
MILWGTKTANAPQSNLSASVANSLWSVFVESRAGSIRPDFYRSISRSFDLLLQIAPSAATTQPLGDTLADSTMDGVSRLKCRSIPGRECG